MDVALTEELVLLDVEARDNLDLLRQAAQRLYEQGYVKESYADAVVAREKVFATGLPTVMGGVAIPHTDVEHVNAPAVCIARLKEPVDFAGDEGGARAADAAAEPHGNPAGRGCTEDREKQRIGRGDLRVCQRTPVEVGGWMISVTERE